MAHLEVPEKYAADLREIAQHDERAVQDVLAEAMDAYLSFRLRETPLSTAHLDRLQQSLGQAERGELIPEHNVEAFFDDWDKEAAAHK